MFSGEKDGRRTSNGRFPGISQSGQRQGPRGFAGAAGARLLNPGTSFERVCKIQTGFDISISKIHKPIVTDHRCSKRLTRIHWGSRKYPEVCLSLISVPGLGSTAMGNIYSANVALG